MSKIALKGKQTKVTVRQPLRRREKRNPKGYRLGKSTTYLEFYRNKLATRRKQAPGRKKC